MKRLPDVKRAGSLSLAGTDALPLPGYLCEPSYVAYLALVPPLVLYASPAMAAGRAPHGGQPDCRSTSTDPAGVRCCVSGWHQRTGRSGFS